MPPGKPETLNDEEHTMRTHAPYPKGLRLLCARAIICYWIAYLTDRYDHD